MSKIAPDIKPTGFGGSHVGTHDSYVHGKTSTHSRLGADSHKHDDHPHEVFHNEKGHKTTLPAHAKFFAHIK